MLVLFEHEVNRREIEKRFGLACILYHDVEIVGGDSLAPVNKKKISDAIRKDYMEGEADFVVAGLREPTEHYSELPRKIECYSKAYKEKGRPTM